MTTGHAGDGELKEESERHRQALSVLMARAIRAVAAEALVRFDHLQRLPVAEPGERPNGGAPPVVVAPANPALQGIAQAPGSLLHVYLSVPSHRVGVAPPVHSPTRHWPANREIIPSRMRRTTWFA